MSLMQHMITALVPRAWAEALEAESRSWMLRCSCGFERSIWAMGGVRWRARAARRLRLRCPACGQRTWHTLERRVEDR